MKNQLIEWMQEIVEIYQSKECVNNEIHMWRNRFLKETPKLSSKESDAKVWLCFLYTPSREMMKKTPEEYIKEIKEGMSQ